MPLCYEAFKNTDKAGLLYEKFEAHRKLTHYKQRILNKFRKMCQIKIITKRSQTQIMACDKYRYSGLTALQILRSRYIMIKNDIS